MLRKLNESVDPSELTLEGIQRVIQKLDSQGRYQEANKFYRASVLRAEENFGELHNDTAGFYYNLGINLDQLKEYEEAEQHFRNLCLFERRF